MTPTQDIRDLFACREIWIKLYLQTDFALNLFHFAEHCRQKWCFSWSHGSNHCNQWSFFCSQVYTEIQKVLNMRERQGVQILWRTWDVEEWIWTLCKINTPLKYWANLITHLRANISCIMLYCTPISAAAPVYIFSGPFNRHGIINFKMQDFLLFNCGIFFFFVPSERSVIDGDRVSRRAVMHDILRI